MLNTIFDQVYIINLPERADRRREMDEQLGKLGLSLSSPNIHLFKAIKPESQGDFPSKGARGCFMSHLGVLEHASQSRFKKILILEDDCNFSKVFPLQLKKFEEIVSRQDWSFLYGGPITRCPTSNEALTAETLDPGMGITGAHFLALNTPAIEAALQYLSAMLKRPAGDPNGGPMHVDGAYSWLRKHHAGLNTLMCSPQLAYQRSSRTDIHIVQWYDQHQPFSSMVSVARRIKNLLQKG